MISLRTRLLAAASVVLAVFVAVTGVALIEANCERAQLAQRERMQGLVYGLLGAADVGPSGELSLAAEVLAEPRFRQPASGLEAAVFDAGGGLVWQSPSMLEHPTPPDALPVGKWRFRPPAADTGHFRLDYAVRWYNEQDTAFRFVLRVREEGDAFFVAEAGFARRLWFWLLLPATVLLLAQLAVLAWALRPLRVMEHELKALEAGRQDRLLGAYPKELGPLRNAFNAMLTTEERRRQRFSDALADLSHSLKTPLAAARALVAKDSAAQEPIDEHLDRMDSIIRFQLARAAMEAPGLLAAPLAVESVIRRLGATLLKVHAERGIALEYELASGCTARIGEDALFELLGNLLDNACKWARHRVAIAVNCDGSGTRITIDDDGPGFPEDDLARWIERGARADQQLEGQGIGLAVASDILRAAGGRLALQRSPSDGARVVIHLPH